MKLLYLKDVMSFDHVDNKKYDRDTYLEAVEVIEGGGSSVTTSMTYVFK